MQKFSELAYVEGGVAIRIRIEGVEWVSSATLTAILLHLEGAFSEIEEEEAAYLAREIGVSVDQFHELEYNVRQWAQTLRGHAIQIEEATKGSLIIGGLIAAVSLWILEKTLGKTIEEAWGESEWHARIKAALNRRLGARVAKLQSAIRDLAPVEVLGVGTFRMSAELRKARGRLGLDVLVAKEVEEAAPIAMMAAR